MWITVLKYVGLIIGSYLMGSIMFAKILTKTQKKDITSAGSGNPGSMNMLRNHGFFFGVLNLILDALKGAIPAICGFFLFGGFDGGVVARSAIYIAGISAVVGHCFPVWYKFKGGKGVATTMGFCMVAHPYISLAIFGVYIILFAITRIGSFCSLICAIIYLIVDTVMLCLEHNYVGLVIIYVVMFLIVWAHRSNIKRLLEKRENVIDIKAVAQKDVDRINNIKNRHQHNKEKDNQVVATQQSNLTEENSVSNDVKDDKVEDTDNTIEVVEDKNVSNNDNN
ncbi:MAG: glycerol-3-phosphate 1-O-acyltransferase PlsY [Firmicutes bacterium]|nr:glycerol-3-phosphate 1-O-acyltransferase PlsY [Bacillota bacterium]